MSVCLQGNLEREWKRRSPLCDLKCWLLWVMCMTMCENWQKNRWAGPAGARAFHNLSSYYEISRYSGIKSWRASPSPCVSCKSVIISATVMLDSPAHRQILYANAESQLQALRDALFIFVKGVCWRVCVRTCTRKDSLGCSLIWSAAGCVRREANQTSYGPVVWWMCPYVSGFCHVCMSVKEERSHQ